MGLFTKSMLILLVAVSAPLLYRQFATDNTVKLMSSYYSNYKVIDKYLRQSADYLDQTKDYLPDKEQLETIYKKLNKQFNQFIQPAKTSDKKSTVGKKNVDLADKATVAMPKRKTNCPGEKIQVPLWTKDELKQYDGSSQAASSEVLLAFLGIVYNVTINAQHYGPGADYNAFAGRDATRAFVTGNFTHDLNDDIADIDEQMYSHFETWASFYSSTYQSVGRVEGKFYDSRGCGTQELSRVFDVFAKLAEAKRNQAETEKHLPECNTEWNGDLKKGRVWCSTKSGGTDRDWVGVPRLQYNGQSKSCVCLNLDAPDAQQHAKSLKVYSGCDQNASECSLQESS